MKNKEPKVPRSIRFDKQDLEKAKELGIDVSDVARMGLKKAIAENKKPA